METASYKLDSINKAQEKLPNNINYIKENLVCLDDILKLFSVEPAGAKWLYLHNIQLSREDPSGNKFEPKIKFPSCYVVHSEEIGEIVLDAIEEESEIKKNYCRPHLKAKRGKNVSIKCVIECCKVLKEDVWKVLEGEEMKGRTSSKKIKVPESSPELEEIVAWILTEGHIPLSHPSIEINQTKEDSKVLEQLSKKIENVFNAESVANFSETDDWSGKKGRRLIISSAAIRQFLVLRYDIPLGKKSKRINWNIDITGENYKNLLSSFIQTEGCVSADSKHPRFEFKIQDESVRDACHHCLEKLGCKPRKTKNKTYNTGIYNFEDFLKLHSFIKKEMNSEKLENKARKIIKGSNILVGLKSKNWCPLVKEAREKLGPNSPNKAFVEKHNKLFPEIKINHTMVSSWALNKAPARLSAAIVAQKVTGTPSEQVFSDQLKSYISSSELKKHVQSKL